MSNCLGGDLSSELGPRYASVKLPCSPTEQAHLFETAAAAHTGQLHSRLKNAPLPVSERMGAVRLLNKTSDSTQTNLRKTAYF